MNQHYRYMKTTTFTLCVLCSSLSTPAALCAAQPLFATGLPTPLSSNSVLYRIDDYGTTPTAIKIGGTGRTFYDVAIDPTTQRFYGVESNSLATLWELNATNGISIPIGNIGSPQSGLGFDNAGQLFAWNGSVLSRVNKQTGLSTPVCSTGLSSGGGDIAFDTNGMLYLAAGAQLIRINTNACSVETIGSFGVSEVYGLEIDSDGVMYAGRGNWNGTNSTGRAELYLVNKDNAVVTPIGAIEGAGTFSLGGLSFLRHTNPPLQAVTSIYLAVEVGWASEANRLYQVLWSSNIESDVWIQLGRPVLGNGSTNYILNSTRGTQKRFYRVLALE